MTDHSPVSPSSAHRWIPCPGSVMTAAQCEGDYDEDSSAAELGRAAHGSASDAIETGFLSPDVDPLIVDYVRDILVEIETRRPVVHVEEKINIPRVHEHCFGTPDCWIYDRNKKQIVIWDFKTGFAPVEVYENWQLVLYLSGILSTSLDVVSISARIVQPHAYRKEGAITTWETHPEEIIRLTKEASYAAEVALGESPRCCAGKQCRYCRARHACPAQRSAALGAMDFAGEPMRRAIPATALAREIESLKSASDSIRDQLTGLTEYAKNEIKNGVVVPGLDVQRGAGRLEWGVDPDVVIALDSRLDSGRKVLTPTQAKNLGVEITGLTTQKSGNLKLVTDDGAKARKVFSNAN